MSDIVLVHGTTQSAAGFAPLVDALEPTGHRVVCLEVPTRTAITAAGYAELLASQAPDDMDQPVVVVCAVLECTPGELLLPDLPEMSSETKPVRSAAQGTSSAIRPSKGRKSRTLPPA